MQRNLINVVFNVFTGETTTCLKSKPSSDVSVNASFSTFARGAVKTSQTQLLAVHMYRQLLKEGGVDWDRNITGAPNQHMDRWEVKEGHLKA